MNGRLLEWLYRKAMPWAIFLAAVAALRDFWTLIFLSYVVGSLMWGTVERIHTATTRPRRGVLICSYACLVTVVIVLLVLIVPRAWREGIEFTRKRVPVFKEQVTQFIEDQVPEEMRAKAGVTIRRIIEETSPARVITDAATIVRAVGRFFFFAFLSLIFSFLVLLDPTFIVEGAKGLRGSSLGWIYCEVEGPVIDFFRIVSRVFDAQIVIATLNTTLTTLAMFILGIPGAAFLAVVVFLCGLIPVIGAFLSSIPILISALVHGGPVLVIKGLVVILLAHALEAYVLNPRIMGGHLKMHPFTVMVTLLVGEHFFGVWGVLMGVPAVTYAVHHVGASPCEAPAPQASRPPAPEPSTAGGGPAA